MNRLRIGFTVVMLSLTLATVAPAHAGRSCEARQPDAVTVERSMDLALQTARELEASGAQVVWFTVPVVLLCAVAAMALTVLGRKAEA